MRWVVFAVMVVILLWLTVEAARWFEANSR